ncbi:MAG: hypothetical protein IJ524_08210 [Bacteroidales bacterium]|nr:hypothetical protein [Bacteroidales bacterium]
MNKEETRLDELIAVARRQRHLRDELLARQHTLAREVSAADTQGLGRVARLARLAVTLLWLVGPSMLMMACVSQPDGRNTRTDISRTVLLADANQAIDEL